MKAYRVEVAPAARDDITAIYAYIIALDSVRAAERWLVGLSERLDGLQVAPRRFRRVETGEKDGMELLRALYFSHRGLFAIDGDVVRVLNVRHGMMDDDREGGDTMIP